MASAIKIKVDVPTFRKDMKEIGYKVRIKRNSLFATATLLDSAGNVINGSNVFSAEHYNQHQLYYSCKSDHVVRDGEMLVAT